MMLLKMVHIVLNFSIFVASSISIKNRVKNK